MSEPVQIADIIDVVCEHFNVPAARLKSPQRAAELMLPRQIAMYLAAKLSRRSLPQIGRAMLRDHTTVLHGKRKVEALVDVDVELRETVEGLEIAALAVSQLRKAGRLPSRAPVDPYALAQRIMGVGDRFVTCVSVDEIRALAQAVLDQRQDAGADDEAGEETAHEIEAAEEEAPATIAPVLLDAPIPAPPPFGDVAHDFLGAEAVYRRMPTMANRFTRDATIEALRAYPRRPEAAALVRAADFLKRAEFTAAERDAEQRYQAAVKALSKHFSELAKKERTHVEIAQS